MQIRTLLHPSPADTEVCAFLPFPSVFADSYAPYEPALFSRLSLSFYPLFSLTGRIARSRHQQCQPPHLVRRNDATCPPDIVSISRRHHVVPTYLWFPPNTHPSTQDKDRNKLRFHCWFRPRRDYKAVHFHDVLKAWSCCHRSTQTVWSNFFFSCSWLCLMVGNDDLCVTLSGAKASLQVLPINQNRYILSDRDGHHSGVQIYV